MLAAIDWTALTIPGAFIVGIILGSVATIRILRHLLEYLRRERDGR